MSKTNFHTTPETYAAANGHWDLVTIEHPSSSATPAEDLLAIQFQNGPVKEHGVNGVQLADVLRICLARYKMLNESFRSPEIRQVITKLQEAIMWDEERTAQRTLQRVEGYDLPHKTY